MTPGEDYVSERAEPRDEERGDAAVSVEELLMLHGQSVLDYAALCTGPSPGAAERLAGQAFRNTYGDAASHAGADFPWRPRLLAAVLGAAREWSVDERCSSLHPDLRDGGTGDVGRSAPGTHRRSGDRSLLLHAFRNLPDRAHALLWHTAVEAEDIAAVASMLGAEPSLLNPERARTLLRDACVRGHLDLAPDERCRRLNRLIDVHARRGSGEMMAEVREHLDGCAYCGAAVDQLDQSPDRLPALLAEAVLGFRAADYVATRTARRTIASAHARSEPAPQPARAEDRQTAGGDPALRWRRWPLLVAMGVVLCGVIAATPVALSGTEDDRQAVGGPTPGPTRSPSDSAPGPSAVTRSPGATAAPGGSDALVTRLRNVRTGLCLDLRASAQLEGTPAVTAECGGSATQLWRLEDGGRMRNQSAPGLCLNAEPQGTLALRPCADPGDPDGEQAGDTRYDLAADGLFTLVAEPGVALTPVRRAVGAIILLEPVPQDRIRRSQRWRTDEATDRIASPSRIGLESSSAG
ncbi:RICIN domain-containing protein [Streptomyces sp. DSM 40750]|uniref:RICIN domain-containing protein n=1 Tax=Streptomyces sp. DSM 40750 TaxID=2801030 RepID=UPI00214BD022|nr:RICIN domain-containing protein [Streptomyces sp. DSM 40750]UUU19426.1 RICIN domain-containing protein [Streptomyces sp. DSM 40750]UUU27230.1 RICIN domain-containing protein [Streptomyces sp. DSM 40750]